MHANDVNVERWQSLTQQHASGYASASPFPHAAFDDFVPVPWCERLLEEFPDFGGTNSLRYDNNPVINRCVIFSTTSWSSHGHPGMFNCPPDRTRMSLALYYYTNGRPDEEQGEKHGTLWQAVPSRSRFGRLARATLHTTAKVAEVPARVMRSLARRVG
jgi:hypothetical protein